MHTASSFHWGDSRLGSFVRFLLYSRGLRTTSWFIEWFKLLTKLSFLTCSAHSLLFVCSAIRVVQMSCRARRNIGGWPWNHAVSCIYSLIAERVRGIFFFFHDRFLHLIVQYFVQVVCLTWALTIPWKECSSAFLSCLRVCVCQGQLSVLF